MSAVHTSLGRGHGEEPRGHFPASLAVTCSATPVEVPHLGHSTRTPRPHGDDIELLPALPDAWRTGSVTGLKARGNVTVDIEWENV